MTVTTEELQRMVDRAPIVVSGRIATHFKKYNGPTYADCRDFSTYEATKWQTYYRAAWNTRPKPNSGS